VSTLNKKHCERVPEKKRNSSRAEGWDRAVWENGDWVFLRAHRVPLPVHVDFRGLEGLSKLFVRVSAWSCELFKYNHAFPAWKIPNLFPSQADQDVCLVEVERFKISAQDKFLKCSFKYSEMRWRPGKPVPWRNNSLLGLVNDHTGWACVGLQSESYLFCICRASNMNVT
jgi:hypothetical protein